MGPGTHVISRVLRGDMPVSRTDAIAMLHDIDYLRYAGVRDINKYDDIAINRAGRDLESQVLVAGLTARKMIGIRFDGNNGNIGEQRIAGYNLHNYVVDNDEYRKMFQAYGLNADY